MEWMSWSENDCRADRKRWKLRCRKERTSEEKRKVKRRLKMVDVYGSRIRSDSVGGGVRVPLPLPPPVSEGDARGMCGSDHSRVELVGSSGLSGGESVEPFRCFCQLL